MSKELYKQLLKAPNLPISMETLFGRTAKERYLSFYNDYVFYKSTWSFFRCFNLEASVEEKSIEVPAEFSIKNFISKYLSSIDPQAEDSVSFGVPVFCMDSAVTLPTSIGENFVSQSQSSFASLESQGVSEITDIPEDDEEDVNELQEQTRADW